MKMIFTHFIDRSVIYNAITSEVDFMVDVTNEFNENETLQLNLLDLDSDELESFMQTLDKATYLFQEDALIWNIVLFEKNFTLGLSYVRDNVSTARPLTELAPSTPLIARFDVPGFTSNAFRELTLRYAEDFDPEELELLYEIGIEVTGNGAAFTIENTTECKVSFYKPSIETRKYIIVYNGVNQIII
jgi:hypothetical protein